MTDHPASHLQWLRRAVRWTDGDLVAICGHCGEFAPCKAERARGCGECTPEGNGPCLWGGCFRAH